MTVHLSHPSKTEVSILRIKPAQITGSVLIDILVDDVKVAEESIKVSYICQNVPLLKIFVVVSCQF